MCVRREGRILPGRKANLERRTRPWYRSKDLTELTTRDLWTEVKDEEEWWGDLKQESLLVVRRLLEGATEGELLEQLRPGRYRRSELRRGHRNGSRYRSLQRELGVLEQLQVPRDRDGHYRPTVLPRYQRRQEMEWKDHGYRRWEVVSC